MKSAHLQWLMTVNKGWSLDGAGDETRTRDVLLGKEVLYH